MWIWKMLLDMPFLAQCGFMAISLFIGLWPIVIPFFILMNFGHALYLFFTPWKPDKKYEEDDYYDDYDEYD